MAEMSSGGPERRRQLMVDRPLQGRMIGWVMVFVVLPIVLFVILELIEHPKPHSNQHLVYLLVNLVLVLMVVLIGLVSVGFRFTNRLVGPIWHFGRQLVDIVQGDYTRVLKFRKGDEFQNVAGAFNHAMAALRNRAQEDIDLLDGIAKALEADPAKAELVKSVREHQSKKEQLIKRS